jgi:hypothetical protein
MWVTWVFTVPGPMNSASAISSLDGGGARPGEYLFELRERLLAMRSAALGYRQRCEDQEGDREDSRPACPSAPADRPSDAAGTDDEVAIPAAATLSRVKRWGGAVASVAVALAIAFVPLPGLGSLLWNVGRVFHVDIMPLRVYWEDLQPGMCVREDPNEMDYLVVDCSAEHEEEVMSRGTLAGSDEWPGDTAVEDAALEKCKPAFATYVGRSWTSPYLT